MTSGCLDRKEVRGAIWGVHSTTDRPAGGNTGRLFLAFGGPVCANRISNCPLDRVLTYKNLIYLLNLQINGFLKYVCFSAISTTNWQYLQSLVVRIPVSNPSEKAYSVVENAKKWEVGCLFYTQVYNSLIFVDALNQG